MEIELSEDLQHYKESIAMGLNVKQLIYSVLSIGAGAERYCCSMIKLESLQAVMWQHRLLHHWLLLGFITIMD